MPSSEEAVREAIQELVSSASSTPLRFSPADARRSARLRPVALVLARPTLVAMTLSAIALVVVASLALSGTFSGLPAPVATNPSGSGQLAGALEAAGGPAPGSPGPLPGTVFVWSVRSGKLVATTTVGTQGTFSVTVPAGSYRVTGRSPLYESGNADCIGTPATVTVRARATRHVQVWCEEK
jgi:hypothetical protein